MQSELEWKAQKNESMRKMRRKLNDANIQSRMTQCDVIQAMLEFLQEP